MKSYNILKILFILLTNERTTIKYLSEQLEVSTRTVKRYLQDIFCLDLPIDTIPGKNGGIVFDRKKFEESFDISNKELEYFSDALYLNKSLDNLFMGDYINLTNILKKIHANNLIEIDFSKWCQNTDSDIKFRLIKQSISNCKKLEFDYYDMINNYSHRVIDPYKIVYKENTWYLLGYCNLRNAARIFKISKMRELNILDSTFQRVDDLQFNFESYYKNSEKIILKMEIKKTAISKIYEDFEISEINEMEDKIIVTSTRIINPYLLSLILSYGSNAKVISPTNLIPQILENVNEMKKIYKGDSSCPIA